MGSFIFNEQKFINDNIFKFEDKLNSQYTRFLDRTPTYVTYYHINELESTVDLGFSNIEEILGNNSPLRFQEIKNFPIYGMESIQFDLNEDEEGLDISHESDLIILPNTIQPLPNDFFTITHLGKDYLFMVTSINYDTIKSNNFYKIGYTIKSVSGESTKQITKQVVEVYNCISENIGTEDKCLIKEEEYERILQLGKVYDNICERYKLYFYKEKYNAFLYTNPTNGYSVYDRYNSFFMQETDLFNTRGNYNTLFLNNEDETNDFFMNYDTSIYKVFLIRKPQYIKNYKFSATCVENMYSTFNFYNDSSVKSVRLNRPMMNYLPEEFLKSLKSGALKEPKEIEEDLDPDFSLDHELIPDHDEVDRILVGYLHNKIESIYNIKLDVLDNLIYFTYTWDIFIKIPILLFCIRFYYKEFMKN